MKNVSITFGAQVETAADAQKLIATASAVGMEFEAAYVHDVEPTSVSLVSQPDVSPAPTAPAPVEPVAAAAKPSVRKNKAADLPKSDAPTADSQSATNSQTEVASAPAASSAAAQSPSATTASPSDHEAAKALVKTKLEADAANRDKIRALITGTGADSISKIPADKLGAFVAAVGKL